MTQCPDFQHLLVLPHLKVQNANAVSSPLTHGMPAMTAFLGLMWALQRKTRERGLDVSFKAVGTVCHQHDEQVTEDGFIKHFRLTRNPIKKDGTTAAIVEEGRIHLTLSLIFAVDSETWAHDAQQRDADLREVVDIMQGMRIAGGSLLAPTARERHRHAAYLVNLTGNSEDRARTFARERYKLLPGFTLVLRDDALDECLAALLKNQPHASRLDAWLSLSRFNAHYRPGEDGTKGSWQHDRKGWLVPIPVGYGALGPVYPPGSVDNARDADTPFRFVESLYSIGEWISPHRLDSPRQLLWYAHTEPEAGRYRCRNDYMTASTPQDLATAFDFDLD